MLGPAPEQSVEPGDQLLQVERLDDVVVGPGPQSGDPVGDFVPRRENADRQVLAVAAQLLDHLDPGDPRQAEVEHHDVRSGRCRQTASACSPSSAEQHGEALEPQGAVEGFAYARIVVDDQNGCLGHHLMILSPAPDAEVDSSTPDDPCQTGAAQPGWASECAPRSELQLTTRRRAGRRVRHRVRNRRPAVGRATRPQLSALDPLPDLVGLLLGQRTVFDRLVEPLRPSPSCGLRSDRRR